MKVLEKPRILDQLRNKIRIKGYSIRTEKTYVDWNKRFILFNNLKHPGDMGALEVERFLSHLATDRNVGSCIRSMKQQA